MILFGLSNAPASFQGYIKKIVVEKLDIFIIMYLDDILIYIKNPGQAHFNAICLDLDILWKYSLFTNLNKCYFCKDEVRFFAYVVFAQSIRIEDKKIVAAKNWPKLKLIPDIQVFLGFTIFYC